MKDAAGEPRRKPGRPRKYGQGRINATVRFTPERYAALKKAADEAGRSVSEEVEARIERSFQNDVLGEIKRDITRLEAHLAGTGSLTADAMVIPRKELAQTVQKAVTQALRTRGRQK
jgi:hypothetical protein